MAWGVFEIKRFFASRIWRHRDLATWALHAIIHDWFWKNDHNFLIVFHSNFFLGCMVSEITRFYCKPDMTSPWFLRQGALSANFHDWFWKSDHYFLIAFHINILSRMHGFRDNEVLLSTGNDVIVISPLGGVSHRFCWRNLIERPRFHYHGLLTYLAYLLPFRSYSTFYFWLAITYSDQF